MKKILKSLLALLVLFIIPQLSFSAPSDPFADVKVVHGKDNRVDAFHLTGTKWEELSRSVAMQVISSDLVSIDEAWMRLVGSSLSESQAPPLCQDELFATQTIVGRCSGFLVSDDHLLTAGHCIRIQSDCDQMFWVFDYELKHAGDLDYTMVPSENIFKCSEIISQHYFPFSLTDQLDFALIKLDRAVPNRSPLQVRWEGKIEDHAPLVVIGYPGGLPKKFADGAKVIENDNGVYFAANLDTFHGNSGSPVFHFETGLVEGILVRGENDYVYDAINDCTRVNTILNQCKDGACHLEDVTRVTVVEKLKETLEGH